MSVGVAFFEGFVAVVFDEVLVIGNSFFGNKDCKVAVIIGYFHLGYLFIFGALLGCPSYFYIGSSGKICLNKGVIA